MPVKRDSDGKIIEERTHVDKSGGDSPTQPVAHRKPATLPAGGSDAYNAKTRLAGASKSENKKQVDLATRIYRPGHKPAKIPTAPDTSASVASSSQTINDALEDPIVGWLVVVDGPGKGNVVTLGNGVNSIGRSTTERLTLDFGDEMISRSGHTSISYDPRGKKFYIQQGGGGTNLTYVNGRPVLAPEELHPNTNILLGNTMLRFVPLCGEQFSWDMSETN